MGSPLQAIMSLLQAPRPRQPVTVRPDYGLTGAMIQASQKSPYERTLRPGETRSPDELRDMLGEVILAAGGAVVPGIGPRGQARRSPTRVPPADAPGQATLTVPRGAQMAKPIKGKDGAQIVGYQWQSRIEDVHSERTGDTVAKRVSDWDRSGTSTGTGREIVHHFYVRHPDGRITLEGINSAGKILGLSAPNLRSVAKVESGKQAYEARQNAAIVQDFEANRLGDTPEAAAQIFARRNPPSPLRPNDPPAAGVLMRKGNKWTKATVGHAGVLMDAGWERVD